MALRTGNDCNKSRSPFLKYHDYFIHEFDSKKKEITIRDPLTFESTITISKDGLGTQFS